MKSFTNDEIIANLEALIKAIEDTPAKTINLNLFSQEDECGTIYCAAGLIPHTEHFQKLGVFSHFGAPITEEFAGTADATDLTLTWLFGRIDKIFYSDTYYLLFSPAGSSPLDDGIVSYATDFLPGRHKELALHRLNWALNYRKTNA